jgi:hypothetical protein
MVWAEALVIDAMPRPSTKAAANTFERGTVNVCLLTFGGFNSNEEMTARLHISLGLLLDSLDSLCARIACGRE